MAPVFPAKNSTHLHLPNPIDCRKLALRDAPRSVALPHRHDVRCGYRHARRRLPASGPFRMNPLAVSVAARLTPLAHHVAGVIQYGAEKQMGRITAEAHITGMANQQLHRIDAERDVEGDPMSPTVHSARETKRAVAMRILTSSPQPAFIRRAAINLRPKALNIRGGKIHKKTARQYECACGSSGSLPNVKVEAGSRTTSEPHTGRKNAGSKP